MNLHPTALIIFLLALTVDLQCKEKSNGKFHSLVKKNMSIDKQINDITQNNLDKSSSKYSHILQTVLNNNEENDASVEKAQPSTTVTIIQVVGGAAIVSALVFILYKMYKKWVIESENQKNLKQFQSQAKQRMDQDKIISVENYDFIRKEKQSDFIKSITNIKYTKIPNKKSKILVIGPISAGKSSLLNRFLNTKLEVGVGQTTVLISPIFTSSQKSEVYDSPGINKDYDICEYRILKDLFKMDTFLVCYQNCLSEVNVIIRILSAIRFKFGQIIYLVRTQCDRFDQSDLKTLTQQIQKDRQYLKLMQSRESFVGEYPILATSSKKNSHFADNGKLQRILLGEALQI